MYGLFDESEIDKQIDQCHAIIDQALTHHPANWVGLLSGGHDSTCACHVASLHPLAPKPFPVVMIDTGIGAEYTKQYVKDRAEQFGWSLEIRKSPKPEDSFEAFVRHQGLPGPGMHQYVYMRIKERVVQQLSQELKKGQRPVMFISGVRRRESQRRMGYAQAIRRGDGYHEDGNLRNPSKMFVAPCIEWEPGNQTLHMSEFGIPRNRIKDLTGMSGECWCGSNAGEDRDNKDSERAVIDSLDLLADVRDEIRRLEAIATELGLPNRWGCKPEKSADTPTAEMLLDMPLFMDLCVSCQKG